MHQPHQYGQVIDVWLSARRDLTTARTFFTRALATGAVPVEVTTDRAPAYPRALDELIPTRPARHRAVREQHDRSRPWSPQARLRPMRGLKTFRSARVLANGHAFVQNLRRGHYEIATDAPAQRRLLEAFDELVLAI